jgi:PAS domain S-box-containing protein
LNSHMQNVNEVRQEISHGAHGARNRIIVTAVIGVALLVGLYFLSQFNYLLFHSFAEGFSIVIAFAIFAIAWNSRRLTGNNYLLFIGIAYLFVGSLDFIHTLAYKGMGVFPGYGTNLATQLWISARYLESLSLLAAPLLFHRKLHTTMAFLSYALVTGLILASIFYWNIFPAAFIDGIGLTPFKVISEYVISVILAGAIWLLFRHRNEFSTSVFRLVVASIAVTITSEMAFTLYTDAYGIANMIGHLLKILSFYLIYKAIIETGLRNPYDLLFRNLKQSEQRWATTLASIGDAVIATDATGKITFMNAVAEALTGWKFAEAANKLITEVLHIINEKTRQASENPVTKVIAEGSVVSLANHTILVKKDGTEIPIDDSGAPIRDQDGGINGVVLVFRDITERRKTEQIKDEFIGLVSHELRTPMTVITGALSVAMSEGISAEESKELLRDAVKSSEDLAQILDNLIELSRYQSDRLRLNIARKDVGQIVQDIAETEGRHQDGHHLTVAISRNLPVTEVDEVRIRHIIRNLLSNAVKYSTVNTNIHISVEKKDDNILIGVKDQGQGISTKDKAKLFQSFERLEGNSGNKTGLGLGLLVCKRLVEAHDGHIWVESEPGQGSTFYFSLPI